MSILAICTLITIILMGLFILSLVKSCPSPRDIRQHAALPFIFFLVGLPFTINLFSELAFVFSQTMSPVVIAVALLSLIATYWYLFKDQYNKSFLIITLIGVAILFTLSAVVLAKFWDGSWDGRAYHQIAVVAFSNGWNPLETDVANIWVNAYPKASWIFAGAVDQISGNLEASKSINLLAMLAAFASVIYLCSLFKIRSYLISVLIAGAVVMNPVVLRQLFTLYLDGYMYLCFVVALVFLISTYVRSEKAHLSEWLIAAMALALLSNLKFTGFVYAVIIMVIIYGYRVVLDKQIGKKPYILTSIITILAIFIIGANPYLKNLTSGAHIFHPVMGSQKHDWVDNLHPPCLQDHNRVSDLVLSNLSRTVSSRACEELELGMPFNVLGRLGEFKNMAIPDWRMSGFGPYYASAMILSLIIIGRLFLVKYYRKQKQTEKKSLILMGLAILLSTLINPELWSARYVPQIWMLAVLPLLPYSALNYKLFDKVMALGIIALFLITGIQTVKNAAKYSYYYTNDLSNLLGLVKQKGEINYIEGEYPFKESFDNTFSELGVRIKPSAKSLSEICGVKLIHRGTPGGYFIEFDQSEDLSQLKNRKTTLSDIILNLNPGEKLIIAIRGPLDKNQDYIVSAFNKAGIAVDDSALENKSVLLVEENTGRWIPVNKLQKIDNAGGSENIKITNRLNGNTVSGLKYQLGSITLAPGFEGVHTLKLDSRGEIRGYYHFNPQNSDVISGCSFEY